MVFSEDLARKLTQSVWCLCTGFYVVRHEAYLFLNDATHADGACEYAVLSGRIGSAIYVQLESITFSRCSFSEALAYVQQASTGGMDDSEFKFTMQPRVQKLDEHGRCGLCAYNSEGPDTRPMPLAAWGFLSVRQGVSPFSNDPAARQSM